MHQNEDKKTNKQRYARRKVYGKAKVRANEKKRAREKEGEEEKALFFLESEKERVKSGERNLEGTTNTDGENGPKKRSLLPSSAIRMPFPNSVVSEVIRREHVLIAVFLSVAIV